MHTHIIGARKAYTHIWTHERRVHTLSLSLYGVAAAAAAVAQKRVNELRTRERRARARDEHTHDRRPRHTCIRKRAVYICVRACVCVRW